MFSYIHDMNIVIECLIPIIIDVSGLTKILNSMVCMNEVRVIIFSMMYFGVINFIRSNVIQIFFCSQIVSMC